jgi:hypothetical protein
MKDWMKVVVKRQRGNLTTRDSIINFFRPPRKKRDRTGKGASASLTWIAGR